MQLNNLIKKLGAFEPDGYPFLSIYLDTRANDVGRDGYDIWLRGQFSEERAKYDENDSELERFDQAAARVNAYLEQDLDPSANGAAIFTSLGDEPMFEAVQLNVAFEGSQFLNMDRPHIFPLARVVECNKSYAVLWADTNKADIYVFGGEARIRADVTANEEVESIQNQKTQKTKAGGWSQGRFQRRNANFHHQHAKEVVDELDHVVEKYGVEKVLLCGDEATIIPVLRPQLPPRLEEKVVGTLSLTQYDTLDEIHERTREAIKVQEVLDQAQAVERMFGAAKAAAGMGTMGLESTLKALSNGQVEELVISSDFQSLDYKPAQIEKVLNDYAPGDDRSSSDTLPIVYIPGEVADELVKRAINSDAKITFIDDSSLLDEAGGVGAVLRFNMNATAGA